MAKIALFLNGERPQNLPCLDVYELIYCVDGAYDYLKKLNITPDLIMGDFDSIDKLPQGIKCIHTPNQNFTDFEKALTIIVQKGYKKVDVFAANGLEQDHFLGNMSTALNLKNKLKITFHDDRQSYYFLDKKTTLYGVLGRLISLYPFPKAKNIKSSGLKYPLKNHNFSMKKNRIGTRNLAINDEVTLEFSKGNLLIFISHNKHV